jgi:glycerol-3-phosphate dehydrogenase
MRRNPDQLETKSFDILVIGGGIHGICVARQAALCGFSVALIEKTDFGHATSANSLKIIHGGLRYLQSADLKNARRSVHARRGFLQITPHIVKPMKFVIPTFGCGFHSKKAMYAAMTINNAISWDRNRGVRKENQIPNSKVISKRQFETLVPGVHTDACSGGALWYDGIVLNTERLALELLMEACDHGGCVCNYVEAESLTLKNDAVVGAAVVDQLSGRSYQVRARVVINATGAEVDKLVRSASRVRPIAYQWHKAVNVFVRKPLFDDCGGGLYCREPIDRSSRIPEKANRFIFFVPLKKGTLIGTDYHPFPDPSGELRVTDEEIAGLLHKVHRVLPKAYLSRSDIIFCHLGLVPSYRKTVSVFRGPRVLNRSICIDHYKKDGIRGLITVVGAKYTSAVILAAELIKNIAKKLDKPIATGTVELLSAGSKNRPWTMRGNHAVEKWARDRSGETEISDLEPGVVDSGQVQIGSDAIVNFTRNTMARKINDIFFRRTDLGWYGCPADGVIERVGEIMSVELGWDSNRKTREIHDARKEFERLRQTRLFR